MSILISNCAALSDEKECGYIENTNIVIQGNKITYVGADPIDGPHDQEIDGRDLLAIPGLINSHTHSIEVFFKGTTDCLPLEMWLTNLFGLCSECSPRDVYLSCIVGAIEMLKTGTTSLLDHFWTNPGISEERFDAAMQAYADVGIRAAIAPMMDNMDQVLEMAISRGFRIDESFFGECGAPYDEQLDIIEAFFKKWHRAEGGRLQCFAGPDGIQWCSEDLFHRYKAIADKYDSFIHMHALETFAQFKACRDMMGRTGPSILRDYGILSDRVSLAHSVWMTDEDIDLLAEYGTMVVHNPACNLKLGSGIAPIRKMIDRGVVVGLGNDGSASSDNQVTFNAMKIAALKHNTTYTDHDKWISARQVMQMATAWGGNIMGHKGGLGYLEPGCLADITLLDLNTAHLSPLNDAFRALVFCETGSSVDTVIVDGKIVVDRGNLVTVDEAALLREIRDVVKSKRNLCPDNLAEVERNMALFEAFAADVNRERPSQDRLSGY